MKKSKVKQSIDKYRNEKKGIVKNFDCYEIYMYLKMSTTKSPKTTTTTISKVSVHWIHL